MVADRCVTPSRIFPTFRIVFSEISGLCDSTRELFLKRHFRGARPRLWHANDNYITSRLRVVYRDVERGSANDNDGRKIVVAKKSPSIAIIFNLGHRAVFDARL